MTAGCLKRLCTSSMNSQVVLSSAKFWYMRLRTCSRAVSMPKTFMSELRSWRSMFTIGASRCTLDMRLKNENDPLTWRS